MGFKKGSFLEILHIDHFDTLLTRQKQDYWHGDFLDIAFIHIADEVFEDLISHSRKVPLKLDFYAKKFAADKMQFTSPTSINEYFWVIGGSPREESGPSQNNPNVLEFKYGDVFFCGGTVERQLFALSKVTGKFQSSDADLIISPLGPTKDALPRDFEE